ncbi:rhamnan synthesis F family protein [Terrimonas alba]|uniref:rhamnan synthesis F family protein n=1 Tax=Terrimonas alba TaxID=3349636 RepID=UPI0035F46E83
MTAIVSILFHNYYGQHHRWAEFFCQKLKVPFDLYYNFVGDSIYNIDTSLSDLNDIRQNINSPFLNEINFRRASNKGKDIGGKLILLDACLRNSTNSEFIIFLHDKKSPYKVHNREWEQRLYRIIEPDFVEKTLAIFEENPKTGIVASQGTLQNEYDYNKNSFISNNRKELNQLKEVYNITITDHRYVAGTMFWVRTLPLLTFFRKHVPLDIRKRLEEGNVLDEEYGTYTHSWERMLSWIISNQGYDLKELP